MEWISVAVAEAIKIAIQMEKDGRAFYEEAAGKTKSELGKKIFLDLARDEVKHLKIFQEIFDGFAGSSDWRQLINEYQSSVREIPVFKENPGTVCQADPNDVEAIRFAMDSERSAVDYYGKLAAETKNPQAEELFNKIREEEVYHYDLLQVHLDSLTGSGVWFDHSDFHMDGMY